MKTLQERKAEHDRKCRRVTMANLATLLGRNRATVMRWVDQGCPVVALPTFPGDNYLFDLAEVVRWLETRSVAKASAEADNPIQTMLRSSTSEQVVRAFREAKKALRSFEITFVPASDGVEAEPVAFPSTDEEHMRVRMERAARVSDRMVVDRVGSSFVSVQFSGTRERSYQTDFTVPLAIWRDVSMVVTQAFDGTRRAA